MPKFDLPVRPDRTPRDVPPLPVRGRRLLAAAATALLLAPSGFGRAAETGTFHLRCTNPASGTSWPIVVDLPRQQVDSRAATITDQWISWADPQQGVYDLNRATGSLRFRNASSTGGYYLFYTCRPD
jgi:hypothetical protein